MNKLACQVTNCQNWDAGMCCLNKITVDGPSACTSTGTCCSNFCEKNNSASNSSAIFSSSAAPDTSIRCEASNCTHNKNCKCGAKDVEMCTCCSCTKAKSETECKTFKPR